VAKIFSYKFHSFHLHLDLWYISGWFSIVLCFCVAIHLFLHHLLSSLSFSDGISLASSSKVNWHYKAGCTYELTILIHWPRCCSLDSQTRMSWWHYCLASLRSVVWVLRPPSPFPDCVGHRWNCSRSFQPSISKPQTKNLPEILCRIAPDL
jgi:hypothetical protein